MPPKAVTPARFLAPAATAVKPTKAEMKLVAGMPAKRDAETDHH